MINLLFYIAVISIALLISFILRLVDLKLVKTMSQLREKENALIVRNWFLRYELYRKDVIKNAKKTGDLQES